MHLVDDAGRVLFAVADGVSSHKGAGTASQIALEALVRTYHASARTAAMPKRLAQAAQQANIEVHDLALVVPELAGMATTLTAAVLDGATLTTVHTGDCRLYLLRGGVVRQLTKDHTVAAARVRRGLLSAERARHHPDRSVLTASLGRELIAAIDRITTPVESGDVFLICSDGLYAPLGDREIARCLGEGDAASMCATLIERALASETNDNATAAVVRAVDVPTHPARAGLGARLRRLIGR